MLLRSQLVEECSDREEVDKLETGDQREAEKQAEQTAECSENAKPILIHVLSVFGRGEIDKVDVYECVVGEIDVLEEAQCIVGVLAIDATCRCLAWITGK